MTVAETIKELTRKHLEENNGLLFAQCITAVGFIGGTVPDIQKGLVELSMSEVSNTGIAVGAALMGRRPIYVIRYQGFMWLAASTLVNYAAKSKDVWDVSCPIFVRSIGMEGSGVGPTASSCQHSLVMRMPGIKVCAPMTPGEWSKCWDDFLADDDPYYCSEHRRSFPIDFEMEDMIHDGKVDVTIFAISAGRINAVEAADILIKKGISVNLIHLLYLKPFDIKTEYIKTLKNSTIGIVVDSDFEICGASRSIAYDLMHAAKTPVFSFGLEDRTGGIASNLDNVTPNPDKIVDKIIEHICAWNHKE